MEEKVKRIKPCAVCRHEVRERVERAALRGESVRMFAGRFTVSLWAVQRHRKNQYGGTNDSAAKRFPRKTDEGSMMQLLVKD